MGKGFSTSTERPYSIIVPELIERLHQLGWEGKLDERSSNRFNFRNPRWVGYNCHFLSLDDDPTRHGWGAKEFDQILTLIERFRELGFECTGFKQGNYYGSKPTKWRLGKNAHLKIEFEYRHIWNAATNTWTDMVSYIPHFRGRDGRFKPMAEQLVKWDDQDMYTWAAEFAEWKPQKIVREKIELPPPSGFKDAPRFVRASNKSVAKAHPSTESKMWIRHPGIIKAAHVTKVAAMLPSGEFVAADDPKHGDIWFILCCDTFDDGRNPRLLACEVAYNGKGYYLIIRVGDKLKAMHTPKRGVNIDISNLSIIDKEILDHAITSFAQEAVSV